VFDAGTARECVAARAQATVAVKQPNPASTFAKLRVTGEVAERLIAPVLKTGKG
jgi:hypothetical protein